MKTYNRWQKNLIEKALKVRRVLVLSGPRQCGKTTLSKSLSDSDIIYRSLDEKSYLETAKEDPHGFVMNKGKLMVIDEVQRAPDLLKAVKQAVDIDNRPGQFLLTGSANIMSLPGVNESLAGRVTSLRLRPLSLGEVHNNPPCFIENALEEKFYTHQADEEIKNKITPYYTKEKYIELAFKGGYPEVQLLKRGQDVHWWYKDYINSLMERDLKDIINIRRKDSMLKLLECLAAWSSKFMDLSQIGSALSIQRPTIETYINALEVLYLVERVRPWTKTDYDRVGKKDKLFMTDTGLMTSILKWNKEKVFFEGDMNGKLLETFVFNQLSSIIDTEPYRYELFHYRDRLNREIDFVIEDEGGSLLGIEVKAGSSLSMNSFKHLKWFKENMGHNKRFVGVVLYAGKEVLRFGEKMWAVPINSLWGTPH